MGLPLLGIDVDPTRPAIFAGSRPFEFRFVQAGTEVSGLMGRLSSRLGYQPTLGTELAELEERICKHEGRVVPLEAVLEGCERILVKCGTDVLVSVSPATPAPRDGRGARYYGCLRSLGGGTQRINPVTIMLQLHSILVPIDFSEHAGRALAHAQALAASLRARLELLHVLEEPTFPSFYNLGSTVYGAPLELKERAHTALEKLIEEIGTPNVEQGFGCHVKQGQAAEEITRFAADSDVDLIVIASHGLGGLEHLLFGSVAEKVVRSAPCPIFVVKAFGKMLLG